MAERTMHSLILLRNDTKQNWATVNPTLLKGEVGVEMDTKKFKVGTGSTAWNALDYFGSNIVYGALSNGSFTVDGATVVGDKDALYIDINTKKIYRCNVDTSTNPTTYTYILIGTGSISFFAGQQNSTSATASTTNGGTYIHLYDADNSTNQKIKITGSDLIKVTNDGSNTITITNTVGYSATGGNSGQSKLIQANSNGYLDSTYLNITGAASTIIGSNLTEDRVLISVLPTGATSGNGKVGVSTVYASALTALIGGISASDIQEFAGGSDNYDLLTLIDKKVDKVSGKGLSTEDFTSAFKTKLEGITEGATKVESSSTNGKIKINGTDVTVYTLPLAGSGTRGGIQIGYNSGNADTTNKRYPLKLSSEKAYVEVPWENTTYTFAESLQANKFTVTPSGGTTQTITINPYIQNNVIYSGNLNNGHIAKWSVTNDQQTLNQVITLVDGPAYGTTGNSVLVMTNSGGKISPDVLPDTITGQLYYKGTWDPRRAPTGTGETVAPTGSAKPEKGWYYIVAADPEYPTAANPEPFPATGGRYDPMKVTVAQDGKYVITHPIGYYHIGDWAVYNGSSWDKIDNTDSVTGVKGSAESSYRIGNVEITAANIGLGNVNNTSDADKPISTATQTALNAKVSADDVLVLNGGHAGLLSTETGYEATYLGRWETIPTRS